MINIAPEKIPADPMPETARPTIRVVELGAAPQSTEPSSKMATATRNTSLTEYRA